MRARIWRRPYPKPLAIDLYCGLGGWTEGLMAQGYDVVGFDIERHVYGDLRYPAQLVLEDVRFVHGSQFKDAALIVASPPCQAYSYMAMPWTVAKAKAADIRADVTGAKLAALNRLFDACFRIQREACAAAGQHIPMVVENVRGAQPWVGKARHHYGSYYLWGDVPAGTPLAPKLAKVGGLNWSKHADADYRTSGAAGCFRDSAIKQRGIARHDSKSSKRKMASALIAKIPETLSRFIARHYFPFDVARAESMLHAAAASNGGG